MCPLFYAAQQRFRQRLFNLRQLQLAAAADRARAARTAWEDHLAFLKADRALILRRRCPRCGMSPHESYCILWLEGVRTFLRHLAGLNPGTNGHHKGDRAWRDWNAGKDGPRGCGPSCWDNSVRAFEGQEDGTA